MTDYQLTVHHARKIYAIKLKLHICIRHSATNTQQKHMVEIVLNDKQRTVSFPITHEYCGQYEVAITELEITDILQLFSKKVALKSYCTAIVMPAIVQKSQFNKLQTIWQQDLAHITTSIHENGEELAQLKLYMPGDQVKKMHWKLSSKLDELYVQQYANLQKHELVIALNLFNLNNRIEIYDKAMEKLAALLMLSLHGENIKLAYWQNHWQFQSIHTEQQIAQVLHKVLAQSVEQLSLSGSQKQQLLAEHANVYIITTNNSHENDEQVEEQAV